MKLVALFLAAGATFAASNWPRFRGPRADGVAADAGLPVSWSVTENVKWKTAIPGAGWSSPVVWGDRVFVTSVIRANASYKPDQALYGGGVQQTPPSDEHRRMAYCLDFKTGKILWERELDRAVPRTSHHPKNSFASETPVTDGKRLYVLFGNLGVFALDMNGKVLWSVKLGPSATRHGWGTASSPALHGDRLFVLCDNDDQSFLTALDKRTGKQLWRVERDEETTWATPFIWENGERTELVTSGAIRMRSYDLEGKLIWELGGPFSHLAIPSPFSSGGLLYLTSGYVGDDARPLIAVKPGATGDAARSIAWRLPQAGPYNPSPIVYGDYLYVLHDRGFLACYDAKTGREIYGKARIDESAPRFTASPWAYNDRIFALSEEGETYVIQPGAEFKVLRKNPLAEMSLATPAVAKGSLFIRTAGHLYRIAP